MVQQVGQSTPEGRMDAARARAAVASKPLTARHVAILFFKRFILWSKPGERALSRWLLDFYL
jgi:hypothetical protein